MFDSPCSGAVWGTIEINGFAAAVLLYLEALSRFIGSRCVEILVLGFPLLLPTSTISRSCCLIPMEVEVHSLARFLSIPCCELGWESESVGVVSLELVCRCFMAIVKFEGMILVLVQKRILLEGLWKSIGCTNIRTEL